MSMVQIWRRPRRRALHAPAWQQMLVLACPPDEAAEAIKAARRLRRAATNPGVHQLTWTVNSLRVRSPASLLGIAVYRQQERSCMCALHVSLPCQQRPP